MSPSAVHPALAFLRAIPRGRVVTYAALARKFGTSPRAIGNIMRTNARPETYPCYKVVASDGALTGYSGSGGLARKRQLLKADGVRFTAPDTVHPASFWVPLPRFRRHGHDARSTVHAHKKVDREVLG
ncbi:MGMT family protein [Candidatus Uhrbacteria bacterium]|nr:MGMT family protein [Candidatus Uhrbacteria bacterium]